MFSRIHLVNVVFNEKLRKGKYFVKLTSAVRRLNTQVNINSKTNIILEFCVFQDKRVLTFK